MNIYDLVLPEEIEELSDDASEAFAEFVRIAQSRYRDWVKDTADDEEGWHFLREARLGYVSTIIAAGKMYNVEPFSGKSVPEVRNFSSDDFDQFKSDLDHYIAQIVLDKGIRRKRDSVGIDETSRTQIRTYLSGLRECIDKADMEESMRANLLKKLADFEAVIDKKRVSLLAVTLVSVALLGAPSSVWGSADIVHRLVTSMIGVVAEAKIIEDASRKIPPIEKPALLQPPRPNIEKHKNPAPAFENDDDDIPF